MNLFAPDLVLENDLVKLSAVKLTDAEELYAISSEILWKYMTSAIRSVNEMEAAIKQAISDREAQKRQMFVIRRKDTNQVIGTTSLGNYSKKDSRVEIGWTWLGKDFQGKGYNKHCKYLLLQFTFERLGMLRVELKTDVLNQQSRRAMLKIGAKEEGVLRSHTLMQDGRRRDTIFYSILEEEWSEVKQNLQPKSLV